MKSKTAPVIRKGQRTPYVKGTLAEIDQRRGAVLRLVLSGKRRMEIHRHIKERHARNWRSADRDVALIVEAARLVTRTRGEYPHIWTNEVVAALQKAYYPHEK